MDLGIDGKVAAVGGASSGLGKGAAWVLAREGARLSICARRSEPLEKTKTALRRASGQDVFAYPCDLSTESGPRDFIEATVRQFGAVDILVCNSGGPPPSTLGNTPPEAWGAALDTSLLSTVRLVQAAIPHMRESGWGRIICMTSVSVKQPIRELILSNTARPGVVGFAKSVALEYAAEGITVNVVCPGYMHTGRVEELAEGRAKLGGVETEDVMAEIVTAIPAGRMGDPRELGALVAFLASAQAGYITGTTIQIDGGVVSGIP